MPKKLNKDYEKQKRAIFEWFPLPIKPKNYQVDSSDFGCIQFQAWEAWQ